MFAAEIGNVLKHLKLLIVKYLIPVFPKSTGVAEAIQYWVHNLQLRPKFWMHKILNFFTCGPRAPSRIRFFRPWSMIFILPVEKGIQVVKIQNIFSKCTLNSVFCTVEDKNGVPRLSPGSLLTLRSTKCTLELVQTLWTTKMTPNAVPIFKQSQARKRSLNFQKTFWNFNNCSNRVLMVSTFTYSFG